jgi:hypothetical protein
MIFFQFPLKTPRCPQANFSAHLLLQLHVPGATQLAAGMGTPVARFRLCGANIVVWYLMVVMWVKQGHKPPIWEC